MWKEAMEVATEAAMEIMEAMEAMEAVLVPNTGAATMEPLRQQVIMIPARNHVTVYLVILMVLYLKTVLLV